MLSLSLAAWSQGVAISETRASPDASAALDIQSNSQGVLIPRMTPYAAQMSPDFAQNH